MVGYRKLVFFVSWMLAPAVVLRFYDLQCLTLDGLSYPLEVETSSTWASEEIPLEVKSMLEYASSEYLRCLNFPSVHTLDSNLIALSTTGLFAVTLFLGLPAP
jgi:hypothetical protein